MKKPERPTVEKPHFRIDWRQLTYYQPNSSYLARHFNGPKSNAQPANEPKKILNSLDGCFRSGQLSAILGPSGAGKSTFLATLFGAKQDGAYGETKVTWFVGHEHDNQLQSLKRRAIRIASLPQHDHLLHHLSVYETLMFASKIKNATTRSPADRLDLNFHRGNVKRVAKLLKLTDCLDTRCGKLSGGQYKRVSIGQELLSEPDVIILDEPTSGLDAMTCLTTIQTLKSIVMKQPMSIILTIHQPDMDVFNLFDHVYVIAQGGLAIYEGPPQNILSTLAQVDLAAPNSSYNPARFIVEHAFIGELSDQDAALRNLTSTNADPADESDDDNDSDASICLHPGQEDRLKKEASPQDFIKRSLISLTEAFTTNATKDTPNRRDEKPLLNIGIQTLDGKLITSEKLAQDRELQRQSERWTLLQRLNQIQKAKYQNPTSDQLSHTTTEIGSGSDGTKSPILSDAPMSSVISNSEHSLNSEANNKTQDQTAKCGYSSSSSGWSSDHQRRLADDSSQTQNHRLLAKAISMANMTIDVDPAGSRVSPGHKDKKHLTSSMQTLAKPTPPSGRESVLSEFVVTFTPEATESTSQQYHADDKTTTMRSFTSSSAASNNESTRRVKLKRHFDKRLSAKHNSSRLRHYPIWYHAALLTHRTWLSIIRDPIFFGIQACMHTVIPVLLALIFGSVQEEGCPRVGNFDLVDFAYSDSQSFIQETVKSIRGSIGNIGIVFFEMFVLSFSINCITALVFPLDMYVLLKEYRNGWYSLRSYFFGRTLADLPVPIVLHSIGMAILYFLTGQPHSLWRFGGIIALVILASLVAQSVGLTVGALLMKSSQSAVLAAAGIVAPFFALSGFIVRIHTLPLLAQLAAKVSYLYYLLNGFIVLRYGFNRCPCKEEDFEPNSSHEIPQNLHTLASIWIGTYSNEYPNPATNKTNVDPNIDVVDKMMTAFKMANSYGHKIEECKDVLPYPMLDFNVRDNDIYKCFLFMIVMLIVSRFITFTAIYYKIRSFT